VAIISCGVSLWLICIMYVSKILQMIIVRCNSAPPRKENLDVDYLVVAHNWHFSTMTRNEPNNWLKVEITFVFCLVVKCSWLTPISILSGLSNCTSDTRYPYLVTFSSFTCIEAFKAHSTRVVRFIQQKITKNSMLLCAPDWGEMS